MKRLGTAVHSLREAPTGRINTTENMLPIDNATKNFSFLTLSFAWRHSFLYGQDKKKSCGQNEAASSSCYMTIPLSRQKRYEMI